MLSAHPAGGAINIRRNRPTDERVRGAWLHSRSTGIRRRWRPVHNRFYDAVVEAHDRRSADELDTNRWIALFCQRSLTMSETIAFSSGRGRSCRWSTTAECAASESRSILKAQLRSSTTRLPSTRSKSSMTISSLYTRTEELLLGTTPKDASSCEIDAPESLFEGRCNDDRPGPRSV